MHLLAAVEEANIIPNRIWPSKVIALFFCTFLSRNKTLVLSSKHIKSVNDHDFLKFLDSYPYYIS